MFNFQRISLFFLLTYSLTNSSFCVYSFPLGRGPASITIKCFSSVKALQQDVHPIVRHQQYLNRGTRRLAAMTGQRVPDSLELFHSLRKRVVLASKTHPACRQHLRTLMLMSESIDVNGTSGALEEGPPLSTPANAVTTPNTIGLNIEANDVGYFGVVQIGTPPRDFNLLMDSGSADMWVGAENCRGDDGGDCGKHTFLGPSSSTSFDVLDESWSIVYGSGAVSGHLAREVVSIANLTLDHFKFGVALNESADFTPDDIHFDGLLGLAKSVISRQRTPTLVEALYRAKLIPELIVSYKIPRLLDGENDGEMMLGALNPAKYIQETLVTVKNTNPFGFWEVPLDDVQVGNKSMGWSDRTAVLDTGTTLLLAPEQDVVALHESIPGAKQDSSGAWTVPCTLEKFLAFKIGGRLFRIDPRDIAFLPVDPQNPTGECISGIGIGYVGPFKTPTQWLVGDVFLKNVYFSTHGGRDEVSVAQLRH